MPKRKRTRETGSTPGSAVSASAQAESEQERAARLFAESIRIHEAADQAKAERVAAAAARKQAHAALVADKESAAARLRHLRAEGRPRQQMADAEAAYRAALAALQEFETGERPHWAPTMSPDGHGEHDRIDSDGPDLEPDLGSDGDQPS